MVMILVRSVPTSLKGELSRWLMEPLPGVFLGHVSAIVRDALWDKCRQRCGQGGCILIYPWPNEQGFRTFCHGNLPREVVDHEGLYLVRKPRDRKANPHEGPPNSDGTKESSANGGGPRGDDPNTSAL